MTIYGTPLEPGLSISVSNSSAQNQVTAPQGLNTCYLLMAQPSIGNLTPNKPNLVTSLADYRNRIGGTPTTYQQLIDYLSVGAFFDNANGAGLLQVIPVSVPQDINTLTLTPAPAPTDTALAYNLSINQQVISGTLALSGPATPAAQLAAELVRRINQNPVLNSIIYVRSVVGGVIEFAPYVAGTAITLTFATATPLAPNTYAVLPGDYARTQNVPALATPTFVDFGQALYTAITEEQTLGFIIAPGFFATSTTATGFQFANLLDAFCRQPKMQHLAYIDVPNPDFSRVTAYSSLTPYSSGQVLAANALMLFNGNVYRGEGAGLVAIPPAVDAQVVPVAGRRLLATPVVINGITTRVIQSLNAAAVIAVAATPTAAELQLFAPVPDALLISEGIAAGTLTILEQSSSTEGGLYNWRDSFDSLEGHVSTVAPYQLYNGLEVQVPYVIPASAYLAALHIKATDLNGLATPPASDAYPLASTAGPIWDVTASGHALLNGKGVNIIKRLGGATYIFGARTLAKADLYNRLNNRAILSAYVRTMTKILSTGIVLRPLDSTGTTLSSIKTLMDRVSEAFYRARLFDGITSGDAYLNTCSNLNNPVSSLQQGVVRATSEVTQIGMIERLVVTIQESLLGT